MARIRSRPSATLEITKNDLVAAVVKAIKDDEPEDGLVIFEVLSGNTDFVEVIVIASEMQIPLKMNGTEITT
jgi:hypothetical protein